MSEQNEAATISADAKRTAGQRTINAIWEVTQAIIAVSVTIATLYVSVTLSLAGKQTEALGNAFFLVVGFYFGRTNHTRIGGVGSNEQGR